MIHAAAVLTPALSLAVGYIQPALGLRSHSACRRPSVHIVIMSGRCVNCTLRCDGYLCRHCKDHIQCVNCCRYLPSHCYSDASKRCLACTRKLAHTRSSVRNIMNEISIPTARGTESFDSFVTTNSGVIQAFVQDYRRNYGSVRLHVRVDAIFTRDVGEGLLQRIPAFFLHRCTILTVHSNSTYKLSPPTFLRRPTIGTLAAAALY